MTRNFAISILALFSALGALATGAGIALVTQDSTGSGSLLQPQVLPATDTYREIPTLNVLLQEGSKAGQMLQCAKLACDIVQSPIGAPSVFDGGNWYYYDASGALKYKDENGEDHLIVSSTDLVAPRDIILSTRGNAVAYWLDNKDAEDEDLTELWVYDIQEKGTHVIAEKLVSRDIVTDPVWNKAGTAVLFIADSGEGKEEKLEFIVASTQPAFVKARFAGIDIGALQDALEKGSLDVSPSGTGVAFTTSSGPGKQTLHVVRDGGVSSVETVRGSIPYIQWVSEGELFYAVQEGSTITFNRFAEANHLLIAQDSGVLISALAEETGASVAYLVQQSTTQVQLKALEVRSQLARPQALLAGRGADAQIVQVRLPQEGGDSAAVLHPLTDGQLIAFIEKQAQSIVGESTSLERIVVTKEPNTVFIDYQDIGGVAKRMLIVVRDAVHPEWVVLGNYEALGGQWRRVGGGSAREPEPARLYEWEQSAFQWILKQDLDK